MMTDVATDRTAADLTQGGLICVLLGEGGDIPTEYAFHAQVLPLQGYTFQPHELDNAIPHNVKTLIFGPGRRLPHNVFAAAQEIIKRRRIAYLVKENTAAVAHTLKQLLPPVAQPREEGSPAELKKEIREIAGKGAIKDFVAAQAPGLLKIDRTLSTAELGRQLFRVAQTQGVTTTLGSVTQAARVWLKEGQRSAVPKSALPAGALFSRQLEEMQQLLANVIPYVKALEERNATLETQIARAKEVFNAFNSEVFPKN